MDLQSDNLNELAKALALAQGDLTAPPKDRVAKLGTYSYNYADLATVIETVKKPLAKHGLSVSQLMGFDGQNSFLVTTLMHLSGQWLKSVYPLNKYAKPQEFGAALTYLRRYQLCAILGISADEDTDAKDVDAGKDKPGSSDPKPNTSRPQQSNARPVAAAEYVVNLPNEHGMHGFKLKDIDDRVVKAKLLKLQAWSKREKKPLTNHLKEFVDNAALYLGELAEEAAEAGYGN